MAWSSVKARGLYLVWPTPTVTLRVADILAEMFFNCHDILVFAVSFIYTVSIGLILQNVVTKSLDQNPY